MEKVLAVETSLLTPYIGGRTGLIKENADAMLKIIVDKHVFLPRDEAEQDPGHKQIIPYVLLTQGGKVFATRRLNKGGESRLHGKISIGIGGHIQPLDETDRSLALDRGLERELEEEVDIRSRGELSFQGFINDDTNAVGSVHLGACYVLPVEGEVLVRETEKLEGCWMSPQELRENYPFLETWTQIALEALD